MSLVMTLNNEERQAWCPPDTLPVIRRPGKSNWQGWRGISSHAQNKEPASICKCRKKKCAQSSVVAGTKRKRVALCSLPLPYYACVAGMFLIVMRLIWHGLNNYLPASDWHSHKKGWVGLGSRWWHSTWPNWSISMLGRRCSTGGQHHTIYFTIYGAQTHGHQSWHPEGLHALLSRCAKVDDIRISHPLFYRMPRKKNPIVWNLQ